jgi:hypothetical protein
MSRRIYNRAAPKSKLDAQRELLDSLMGSDRNGDYDEDAVTDYNDDQVCKFYLLGICPHDLFANTKVRGGSGKCSQIHSESLKMDFERDGDPDAYNSLIEREFLERIAETDRSIGRKRDELDDNKKPEAEVPELNHEVIELQAEIEATISQAEVEGEEGRIDKCVELVAKSDELERKRKGIIARISESNKGILQGQRGVVVDVHRNLRVCDTCGSLININETDDRRLQDHFQGKQHMGFKTMRDFVAKVKAHKLEKSKNSSSSSSDKRRDDRDRSDRDRSD